MKMEDAEWGDGRNFFFVVDEPQELINCKSFQISEQKEKWENSKHETETLSKSITEQHKRSQYNETQSPDVRSLLSFNMLIKHSSRVFSNCRATVDEA